MSLDVYKQVNIADETIRFDSIQNKTKRKLSRSWDEF